MRGGLKQSSAHVKISHAVEFENPLNHLKYPLSEKNSLLHDAAGSFALDAAESGKYNLKKFPGRG